MIADVLRKPYQDMKAYLIEQKNLVIKCFVLNNANLKRIKQLDIIPVTDEEYKKYQFQVNKILNNIQATCQSLEKINKITKEDYTFMMVMDKSRIQTMSEESLNHTKNFYKLVQECVDDDVVTDRYLDDVEQLHFMLNKFLSLIIENYSICIERIDGNLKDLEGENQK